ncbi:inosine/xanthosine triphosphatase [Mangrovibacterium marinum]|uniref:inosine/xanthosine triphosphatase n=1 Tax=Mangrovibacterium marinum TaxID=1639118 RepID=UPI002A18B7EB|nr:inosine/xanthosine triphosphatase [Mangrovibacterium marinum]
MKVVVASQNPVKVNAVLKSFRQCWPNKIEGKAISVASGVPDQPMGEEETRQGAVNRVRAARELVPSADFYVGVEGGVQQIGERLFAFAWIAVSNHETVSLSRTGAFELPPQLSRLVLDGMELGDADDLIFKTENSKQQNGAVGLLTRDLVTRQSLYEQAVLLALIPFLNEQLYPQSQLS